MGDACVRAQLQVFVRRKNEAAPPLAEDDAEDDGLVFDVPPPSYFANGGYLRPAIQVLRFLMEQFALGEETWASTTLTREFSVVTACWRVVGS